MGLFKVDMIFCVVLICGWVGLVCVSLVIELCSDYADWSWMWFRGALLEVRIVFAHLGCFRPGCYGRWCWEQALALAVFGELSDLICPSRGEYLAFGKIGE